MDDGVFVCVCRLFSEMGTRMCVCVCVCGSRERERERERTPHTRRNQGRHTPTDER